MTGNPRFYISPMKNDKPKILLHNFLVLSSPNPNASVNHGQPNFILFKYSVISQWREGIILLAHDMSV